MAGNYMESPMQPVKTPTTKATNPGVAGGEDGYKKRTGGLIPEKLRENVPGFKKPKV